MIQFYILLSMLIGFVIVTYSIPKIIYISNKKKLFDIPNERSAASTITPNLGGIAIFAGFIVSIFISLNNFDIQTINCLLLASFVMFLTGLKDDLINLVPRKKFLYQLLAAMYLIFMGKMGITNMNGVMGIHEIDHTAGTLITLFAIVGIVNAYNLIDGIDGLAAGLGVVISITLGSLFWLAGEVVYSVVAFSLCGCLVAFFFFNVFGRVNKIFMGDTGSLTVGIIFAFLIIRYVELPESAYHTIGSPAIALAILIVPIIDTLRVMSIRIYRKRSPFSPDKNHIHHQLLRLTNGNHLHATLIMIVANVCFIISALSFVDFLGNNWMFFIILTAGFTIAYLPVAVNKYNDSRIPVDLEPVKVINLKQGTKLSENKAADQ